MYRNIVLSGGSTMFPGQFLSRLLKVKSKFTTKGIKKRLESELVKLVPATKEIKIAAQPERKFSVWIGGSILASLPSFQKMWITREQYDEYGASVINNNSI